MKDKKNEPTDQKPPFSDTGYVGNVWGWKFSYMALIFMLFVLAAVSARYCYVKTYYPERFEQPRQDTIKINPRLE